MENETKKDALVEGQEPVEFMEEEQPGVSYIRPHLEVKLTDKQRHECREIVREIKSFGVNQRQILFLVDLLALELENNDTMRRIRGAVVETREKMDDNHRPGLILSGE